MTSSAKDAELAAILDSCSDFLETRLHNSKVGDVLKAYIIDEECDLDFVHEDLEEGYAGSALVEALAEHLLQTSDQDFKHIWNTLRKLFLQISNTVVMHETTEKLNFAKLNLELTSDDTAAARLFMHQQCPNAIKPCEGESIIRIIAVGKKNNIHLLTLLYDLRSRFNATMKMKKVHKTGIFCGKKTGKYSFQELFLSGIKDDSTLQDIDASLTSFEKRLIPGYKFSNKLKIIDDCNVYIEYILLIAKVFHKMQSFPLQVDLVIIPKGVRTLHSSRSNININGSSIVDECEQKSSSSLEPVFRKFVGNRLQKCTLRRKRANWITNTNNNNNSSNNNRIDFSIGDIHALTSALNECVGCEHHRRIPIVIDRRTTPNEVFMYTLPNNRSVIPSDYNLASLIFNAANYVLPNKKQSAFIGGSTGLEGNFQVSFQGLSEDHIRLQWFYAGGGIRLWPELMVKLWPTIFLDSKIDPRFTADFIKEQLKFNDFTFDPFDEKFHALV